ncbi:hypothetical protein ACFS07_16675 [Undibacterium arcticum]
MPIEPITHTQPQPGMAPSAQRPVRLIARDLDTAELLAAHSHRWGQVTHASLGLIRVTVGNSSWIVPPLRAIWIPPNALHEIVVLEKKPTCARSMSTPNWRHSRAPTVKC